MVATNNNRSRGASPRLMDLMTRLRRCCQEREAGIREESGLGEAEYACVNAIAPGEQLMVGELCARMGLSKSRGGRVVDHLVQRKLLERRADADDRRVAHVRVTARGRAVQRRVSDCVDACETALRRKLNPTQQRAAHNGLALMLAALEEA